MEERGQLIGVVTQNIDGLHQKAGSKNVQEIHGTIWRNYCVSCGAEYDENYIFDSKDKIPVCEKCGKMVRPDVTLYGEFLPEEAYRNAINMMIEAMPNEPTTWSIPAPTTPKTTIKAKAMIHGIII